MDARLRELLHPRGQGRVPNIIYNHHEKRNMISDQESLIGLERPTVDNKRDRAMSLDRTPLPVVRQILKALSLGWGDEAVQ